VSTSLHNPYYFRQASLGQINNGTTSSEASRPITRVFNLKRERNKRFVDRPDVFDALNKAIEANKHKQDVWTPITICGLGGMGKSQIAVEFCYCNKDQYQYILWLDADTETSLQQGFREGLVLLGLQPATAVLATMV
jgi:hypothetical protein